MSQNQVKTHIFKLLVTETQWFVIVEFLLMPYLALDKQA